MKRLSVLIAIFLLILQGCGRTGSDEYTVCFGEHCFDVEVAFNARERARGMMFREDLDSDRGMLFIFEREGIYPFWMKNTLIPLDIIWLDTEKKVVFISKNTQPCGDGPCPLIHPTGKAKYVLELNSGMSEKIGLNITDTLSFDVK